MRIDTRRECFNMLHIDNRRFMFNPQTGTLILGYSYKGKKIVSSHAEEHANADTGEPYDLFLRGWIGTDKKNYKYGVIHFAPCISSDNAVMFSKGFDTLEMFKENGADNKTVVRGFGRIWEQPFSDLIKEADIMADKKETSTQAAEAPISSVTPIVLESENMRDKVKEITDKLEQGIKDLFDSEKYKAFLDTMAKFHRYSYNNSLLIMFQKPDASAVAGYTDWIKKFHRYVRKGEKGIKILSPAPYKKDVKVPVLDEKGNAVLGEDGNKVYNAETVTVPAFKVTTVFDVSQTEGEPLPSISSKLEGNIENYEKFFRALKEISPVPIELETIDSAANGYFNPIENRIAVRNDLSEMQTIKTAIHEIAHAKLHSIEPNEKMYEVVELFGKKALFLNERIDDSRLPDGLYRYDLRGSDNDPGIPISVEKNVAVNHAGCIILSEPMNFDGKDYIPLDDELNFTGEEKGIRELWQEAYPDKANISRNTKEVQAESVAYTVCQRFGLDTSDYSFGYIAGWSSGRDIKELKESLKVIRAAAADIIRGIEQRMPELTKEQEQKIDLSSSVGSWYVFTFPTDEHGIDIKPQITFGQLNEMIEKGSDMYAEMGTADSVIRERCFEKLAEIMNVEYSVIYDKWLAGNEQKTQEPKKETPEKTPKAKKPSIRKQLDENKKKCKEKTETKKPARKKSKELEV